ncbi:high affinity copper uptake protein 1-like [Paramacrobiotus metropolitanus]|uniref:high affinity copper uptake protein 1-like n=1 Tax=Paramacrobiotus metropolitanus TaxID=2943436 RepID=UPI002445F648|nr:high affinity copper uptake protein 1-like [Paramacrobiotus metropolitanus]
MDMMPMYFTLDYPAHILFKPWSPQTTGEMVGACVAIFIIAFCFEALKLFRRVLFIWDARRQRDDFSSPAAPAGEVVVVTPRWRGMFRPMHVLQTVLTGVQFVLGYFLMLAAMTFSVWLFVAMIAGTMVGYFAFQWYPAAPGYFPLQNEHCH